MIDVFKSATFIATAYSQVESLKSGKLLLERDLKQLQARVASLQAARAVQPSSVAHNQQLNSSVCVFVEVSHVTHTIHSLVSCV